MSGEDIVQELSAYSVVLQELKYSTPNVSMYHGLYAATVATVKVLLWQEGMNYAGLERECSTVLALSHPNILKLLTCFWVQRAGKAYYVIVTEWCAKDLEKDIQQRVQQSFRFTEKDLLAICRQSIDALACMQTQGLVHGNLKPQNIFLTSSKSVKIGGFGSTAGTSDDVVSTPYYLSPILKQALVTWQVQHDPFKSDVYSLGLTILGAAKLGLSARLMRGVSDEEMGEEIASIPFSEEVKTLLRAMLGYEECSRWDFLQLRQWVSTRPWGVKLLSSREQTHTPVFQRQMEEVYGVRQAYSPTGASPSAQTHFPDPNSYQSALPVAHSQTFLVPEGDSSQFFPINPSSSVLPEEPSAGVSYEAANGTSPALYPQPESAKRSVTMFTTKSSVLGTCLQCGREVNDGESSLVQLLCKPDHMYCSNFCFLKSVTDRPSLCPRCGEEIHPHLLCSLRKVSSKFPACLVCAQIIDLPNPAVRATLPLSVCSNNPGHICCSEHCNAQLNGKCRLCSMPKGKSQAPLLLEKPVPKSWFSRFLHHRK